jgi:hypothetical protein
MMSEIPFYIDKNPKLTYGTRINAIAGPRFRASKEIVEYPSCASGLLSIKQPLPEVEEALESIRNPKEGDKAIVYYGEEVIPIVFHKGEWIDELYLVENSYVWTESL